MSQKRSPGFDYYRSLYREIHSQQFKKFSLTKININIFIVMTVPEQNTRNGKYRSNLVKTGKTGKIWYLT